MNKPNNQPPVPAKITDQEYKIGDTIFKGGARANNIYFIQTGRVLVSLSKESVIEFHFAESQQCLGEELLFGSNTVNMSSLVVEKTFATEVPVEFVKSQMEKLDPESAAILKGLYEKGKTIGGELKGLKMAKEALPCPPDNTAKVFGLIYHCARFFGHMSDGILAVKWDEFQDYVMNVMEESPYRLRQGLNILAKLGYVDIDIEVKGLLFFKDMTQIEAFFEFYQNYHFKSGYASLLKTNDKITAITQAVLKVAEPYTVDRMGLVRMPFKPTIDALKEILGKSFEADGLFRLEQKGLLVKRTATQEGGILSFYKAEFEQMLLNWKVLKEVELWNERGYVDMTSYISPQEQAALDEEIKSVQERIANWQPAVLQGKMPTIRTDAPKAGELLCPTCMSEIRRGQKFCDVCDCEIKNAA